MYINVINFSRCDLLGSFWISKLLFHTQCEVLPTVRAYADTAQLNMAVIPQKYPIFDSCDTTRTDVLSQRAPSTILRHRRKLVSERRADRMQVVWEQRAAWARLWMSRLPASSRGTIDQTASTPESPGSGLINKYQMHTSAYTAMRRKKLLSPKKYLWPYQTFTQEQAKVMKWREVIYFFGGSLTHPQNSFSLDMHRKLLISHLIYLWI